MGYKVVVVCCMQCVMMDVCGEQGAAGQLKLSPSVTVTFCYCDCSSTRTWQLLLNRQIQQEGQELFSHPCTTLHESNTGRKSGGLILNIHLNSSSSPVQTTQWKQLSPKHWRQRWERGKKRWWSIKYKWGTYIKQAFFKAVDISCVRIWSFSQFPNQCLTIDWYHL